MQLMLPVLGCQDNPENKRWKITVVTTQHVFSTYVCGWGHKVAQLKTYGVLVFPEK